MSKTILILDDELSYRELLRDYFEDIEFTVLEAVNAEEAIDQIMDHQVDLVIVDLGLPKFSGENFLNAIQTELPEVPCLVLSGLPKELMADTCKELGSVEYFEKPVDLNVLGDYVKNFLLS